MEDKLSHLIAKSNEIHNNAYDYSLINEYRGMKIKNPIICKEHGVFYKDFEHHISRKQGCPFCSNKGRYDTKRFIEKASKLEHCSNYSFDKVEYINNKTKITVTCKDHGDFEIAPGHLLSGEGCPRCRYIKSANGKRRSLEDVISLAKEIHGDKYDYSLITEYKNDREKYPIICKRHGVFYQAFNNHIKGKQGCPVCGHEKTSGEKALTTEEFIEKAKIAHGDKYDYSKVDYTNGKSNVTIICPVHGEFSQIARNHIFGEGCPKCFKDKSFVEKELLEFIQEILPNETIIENDRSVLDGKEIDVYVPKHKIGFEMNGLIWHSEKFENNKNYHLSKTEKCAEKNVTLIHIFEDEWKCKNEICKSRIRNILHLTSAKIYARNCEIREVSLSDSKLFLQANHLQGYVPSKIRIGLYYKDELVSLMTFGKKRINISRKNEDNTYELIRFCNKIDFNVIGAASKLVKYFIEKYNPLKIETFADRRWSNGNLYEAIGFEFYGATEPSYFYVVNKKRINRFSLRKNVLVEKYGCPKNMTEKQFCENNGWYRIYDCGTLKYVWKNER